MQILSWSKAEFEPLKVKITPLVENENTKEIQILMAKDSQMPDHKAPFDISVQVLKGAIDFEVRNEVLRLNELDMITLKANEAHSLRALQDSIVRLSLSKLDSVSRVSGILKKN